MFHKITNALKYVVQETVNVLRFKIDKATKEIFAKFTNESSDTVYAAHIMPGEFLYYTDEPINDLQVAIDRGKEKIWWGGSLDDIRARRQKEDTLSKYSTELSILTKEEIKVTDYVADGNHYLLFASNGCAYEVKPNGSTWSTKDSRVKTLDDCRRYSKEKIWINEGDINNPKISRG